jgi:predicted PurR-regulated permease PerM
MSQGSISIEQFDSQYRNERPVRGDITHTILSVLFISLLIASTFWILRPFLVAIVWGTIVVVATWPLFQGLQNRFAKRRGLAVLIMAAALLLIVLVPVTFAVLTIAKNAEHITAQVKSLDSISLPSPPHWLSHIPLYGTKLVDRWSAFAALSPDERQARLTPYLQKALRWFVALAGSTGATVLSFLLTMIVAIVLYAKGEVCREAILCFARRLAGRQGEEVAILAGKAVRGVVLGVVVTALAQAAVAGIGLLIAGVPAAVLLAAVTFMLCLAQLGPWLVMLPAVIWLYGSGQAVWGTVLLIFAIVAGTVDNFLRPYLIKKGVDLPLLLILAGVIGGLIAFGVVGLFIAPVILAVAYTLLKAWVAEEVPVTKPAPLLSKAAT